jgi:hypothetical protein
VRVSSECVCRSVAGEERERERKMKGWILWVVGMALALHRGCGGCVGVGRNEGVV